MTEPLDELLRTWNDVLQSIIGVSLTSKKYEIEVENEGSLFVSRE